MRGPEAEIEHVDVLMVGAGLLRVSAGRYTGAHCPRATFAILEARDNIDGTWDLLPFPGVRSDSEMYTLGHSFRPWNGEQTMADGVPIRDYIRETAKSSGVEGRIRLRQRVTAADWSPADRTNSSTCDGSASDGSTPPGSSAPDEVSRSGSSPPAGTTVQ